jgi:ABC-type multidrug transport system ATPase subunit
MSSSITIKTSSLPSSTITPNLNPICSNATLLDLHLCDVAQVQHYYQYMLLTNDPEKVPGSTECPTATSTTGKCAPGFFDPSPHHPFYLLDDSDKSNRDDDDDDDDDDPPSVPCCEGYFCPPSLTCMMPCPLGAYCPTAVAVPPPRGYIHSITDYSGTYDDNNSNSSSRKKKNSTMWCAPYGYRERIETGCGGADRWTIVPDPAFPGFPYWDGGSGNIFCPGGHYCNTTTAQHRCPKGRFCRRGTTEPERCPLGANCPHGTEVPLENITGFTLDVMLIAVVWLLWKMSAWYNEAMMRLGVRERLKIVWNGHHPRVDIVQDEESSGGGGGDGGVSGPSMQHRHIIDQDVVEQEIEEQEDGGIGTNNNDSDNGLTRPLLVDQTSSPSHDHRDHHHHHSYTTLEFKNLVVRIRSTGRTVLQGTTGRFTFGRVAAVMGPSGCGKTLLMSCIIGRAGRWRGGVEMVEGEILLDGEVNNNDKDYNDDQEEDNGGGDDNDVLHQRTGGRGRGHPPPPPPPPQQPSLPLILGFVPQDDVLHPLLTVEENLMFSARYRLPATCSRQDYLYSTENVIRRLGLSDVRHCLVGNVAQRGISGGQKKRCNVGVELVAGADVLILDEPTSGLDATASKSLIKVLGDIAHSGTSISSSNNNNNNNNNNNSSSKVLVAAVVHQPSWSTFELFDDLLLLAPGGGRAVYCGPRDEVEQYFAAVLGIHLPPRVNPADALLDIVSSKSNNNNIIDTEGSFGSIIDLDITGNCSGGIQEFSLFPNKGMARRRNMQQQGGGRGREEGAVFFLGREEEDLEEENGAGNDEEQTRNRDGQSPISPLRPTSPLKKKRNIKLVKKKMVAAAYLGYAKMMEYIYIRIVLPLQPSRLLASFVSSSSVSASSRSKTYRKTPGFLRQFTLCLSRARLERSREPLSLFTDYAVVALTGTTVGLLSDRGKATIMKFAVSTTYNVVAVGLMTGVGGVGTFTRSSLLFQREASSGLNKLSYFTALDFFDLGGLIIKCAVYLAAWYAFASPRAVVWQMYAVTLAIAYCCTGMAYWLSQIAATPETAQLAAAILALLCGLVARQDGGSIIRAAQAMSFARWGLEGFVIAESNRLTGVWLLARCADLKGLGYDVRRFGECLVALIVLGIVSRVAAFMSLVHKSQ